MFDKLEDLLIRFEEIMGELNEPDVTANQERFRALMKEQSDLTPIVEAYREYKKCNQDIEDSLMMLDEENDPDMREMLKEELNSAKTRVSELEEELKECLVCLHRNEMMFDLEVDTDLIEQHIYERQALLARYRYLLGKARELGLHTILEKYQPVG